MTAAVVELHSKKFDGETVRVEIGDDEKTWIVLGDGAVFLQLDTFASMAAFVEQTTGKLLT
jgi:hypothetical protein